MVIIEDKKFMSGRCINKTADSVAKDAFNLIFNTTMGKIGKISNEEILGDECLLQQMGEIDIVHTIKVRWRESREAITLVHQMNIENIREAIVQANQNRRVLNICKKVIRAKYLRVIKLATQNNIVCQESGENRIKLITGKYQILSKVTSKEFRLMLGGVKVFNKCRYLEDLDNYTMREYLNQVKRLVNTRQKNILLRIWNGDCLSYSRLSHFGIVPTSECPNCRAFDSPLHMLTECVLARQVWQQLKAKIPIRPSYTLMQYAIGINDSWSVLMVKAEILKYLMHFRDWTADQIVACVIMYLKMVNRNNPVISQL